MKEYRKREDVKARKRLQDKKYREENKELLLLKGKEYSKKYRDNNKDSIKTSQEKFKLNNPERYKEIKSNWKKNNLDSVARYSAKRRSSKFNATPDSWGDDELNEFIIKEAYSLAKLRSNLSGFKWHVDHIIPLNNPRVCGLHVYNNLQVIPYIDNLKKGNSILF